MSGAVDACVDVLDGVEATIVFSFVAIVDLPASVIDVSAVVDKEPRIFVPNAVGDLVSKSCAPFVCLTGVFMPFRASNIAIFVSTFMSTVGLCFSYGDFGSMLNSATSYLVDSLAGELFCMDRDCFPSTDCSLFFETLPVSVFASVLCRFADSAEVECDDFN